jgi:hypothetical protein
MRNIVGVNPDYDYLLDPQMAESGDRCDRCGCSLYGGGRQTEYETLCEDCWEDLYG